MKKFTNLDEEILKENADVANKFSTYMRSIFEKLDKIKIGIDNMAIDQVKDPRNWGYVGNMVHINDELDNILIFLNSKKEE